MHTGMHIFISLCISLQAIAGGQSKAVLDYIEEYKWLAIEQMRIYKIPASITLAQGILESGAGLSELAQKSNNHFGIKCHSDWKGDKVYYDDDAKDECFRKYKSVADSYKDHSEFLANGSRYSKLFALEIDDYKGWAKGLKAAGYATNPKYAELLIDLIEKYALHAYDDMQLTAEKGGKKTRKKEKDKTGTKESGEADADGHFSWNGYDADVFYFNRIPTVIIKPGDTPASLAEKHNTKASYLLKYNNISASDSLIPGKNFYLQPKRKKGKTKYHVVKPGETLLSISRDEGILLEELYKKNKLNPGDEPAAGETLFLRGTRREAVQTKPKKPAVENAYKNFDDKTDDPVQEENNAHSPSVLQETTRKNDEYTDPPASEPELLKQPQYHIVEAKETLYSIAKKYAVSVDDIKRWNNLENNTIYIGQEILVSPQ
jgi:LysM repeat protein